MKVFFQTKFLTFDQFYYETLLATTARAET